MIHIVQHWVLFLVKLCSPMVSLVLKVRDNAIYNCNVQQSYRTVSDDEYRWPALEECFCVSEQSWPGYYQAAKQAHEGGIDNKQKEWVVASWFDVSYYVKILVPSVDRSSIFWRANCFNLQPLSPGIWLGCLLEFEFSDYAELHLDLLQPDFCIVSL